MSGQEVLAFFIRSHGPRPGKTWSFTSSILWLVATRSRNSLRYWPWVASGSNQLQQALGSGSVSALSAGWDSLLPASLGFFFKSTHRLGIRGEHTSPSNRSCRSKVVDHPAAIRVNLYNMFFGVFWCHCPLGSLRIWVPKSKFSRCPFWSTPIYGTIPRHSMYMVYSPALICRSRA